MSPRILPASVLMPEYEALLREGAELPLVISGGSMLPFLAPGRDSVMLKARDRPLRRGDIVFYRRANGAYILHRLLRVRNGSCWMVGDAQTVVEGPLDIDCIFAYVTAAQRKGKVEKPGTFWWDFFAHTWLRVIPLRRIIMKIYGACRAIKIRRCPYAGSQGFHHARDRRGDHSHSLRQRRKEV